MNRSLVRGSLAQVARQSGFSLAETWINVEAVILVDISGSMNCEDAPGGKSRYAVACAELASLQASLPGRLAIIAFAQETCFAPSGSLPGTRGTTNLAGALKFARAADAIPGMRFILISDGEPDHEESALAEARLYRNRIDTLYVGPAGGPGQLFLQKLAALKQGQALLKPQLSGLASGLAGLLSG